MVFVKRRINIEFTLKSAVSGASSFLGPDGKPTGKNTLTLTGPRVQAKITNIGAGGAANQCQVSIYGMQLSHMNSLSTLGKVVFLLPKDAFTIYAGEEDPLPVVFSGEVINAYINLQGAPNTPFVVDGQGAFSSNAAIAPATSYRDGVDVARVIEYIATELMGLKFENNGVSVIMPKQYYPGSPMTQLIAAAYAAGIAWTVERGVVAIWPKTGARRASNPLIVSKKTGMIGYPTYTGYGITVKSIFNPAIRFGDRIEVESSLDEKQKLLSASGPWNICKLDAELASETPKGPWQMTMECIRPGIPQPVLK